MSAIAATTVPLPPHTPAPQMPNTPQPTPSVVHAFLVCLSATLGISFLMFFIALLLRRLRHPESRLCNFSRILLLGIFLQGRRNRRRFANHHKYQVFFRKMFL